jgi:hypothetical protein
MKIKFRADKKRDCLSILPYLDLSWVQFRGGKLRYIQFGWFLWFIELLLYDKQLTKEVI